MEHEITHVFVHFSSTTMVVLICYLNEVDMAEVEKNVHNAQKLGKPMKKVVEKFFVERRKV